MGSTVSGLLKSALVGALVAPFPSLPIASEPSPPIGATILAERKDPNSDHDDVDPASPIPTRGTLANLHTGELLVLSESEPTQQGFSRFLRDRVTGDSIDMAPRLIGLLRQLTAKRGPVRIEFISGYRSWKLNEMLRKKGHNVASQSQHSLGTAMDFRIEGLNAKQLANEVEALRWKGGLAYYPGDTDRFVHADVGPNRRWRGR